MQNAIDFFNWMFADIPLNHNIVITSPDQYTDKGGQLISYHKQRAALSAQEASSFCDEFRIKGKDVFYGIALYADNLEAQNNGKTKVRRTKKHAKFLPCLIADIDCGAGKPYPDAVSGAEATTDAMFALGFRAEDFTLVCSGGGVHLYVKLEDLLIAEAWEKLAYKFKNALLAQKLDIDISKTTDTALILRPVGTVNFKQTGNPRPVEVIHHGGDTVEFERLDVLLEKYGINPELKMSYTVDTATNDIFAQMPDNLPESNISIFEQETQVRPQWQKIKCPQLMALEQDCNVPEPLWYQALGIAAYTEDPVAAATAWSKEYAGFNEQRTMHKMAQYLKSTTGPALCTTFENLNSELCKNCKFKGIIKTPISATIEIGERVVSIDAGQAKTAEFTLPPEYRISSKNEIIKIVDGMEIVVSDYLIFLESIARHDDTRNPQAIMRFAVKLPSGVKYLEMNANSIVGGKSGEGYQSKFFQLGVAMSPKKMLNLGNYIIDCYKFYQENKKDISMKAGMGWMEDDKGFVWGDKVIKPSKQQETVLAATSTMKSLSREYTMNGSLELWKKAVAVFGAVDMEHLAFAILLGFASPLYRFTNLEGVSINFYSEYTGTGKTTACSVAQSIYGRPSGLTMEKTSTNASIYARLGTIRNLPGFMDEISDSDGARVSDLLYSVATGKERDRSDVNGDLKDRRTWSLIFMTTSNKSVHEKLDDHNSSSAGQKARLIEVLTDPSDIIDKYGEFINQTISENYGVAAPIYLSYLVDAVELGYLKDNLKEGVAKFEEKFNFKFSGNERFIKAAVIMAWVAGLIAKKLDLLPEFDLDRVIKRTLEIVKDNRQRVLNAVPTIDNLIGDFLIEKNKFIIQNYSFIGAVNPLSDQPRCWVPDEPKARMDVSFRVTGSEGGSDLVIPNSAILTIPVKVLKDYCRMNRIPFTSVEANLSKMKDFRKGTVSFMANLTARETASGMPLSSVSLDCYKFVMTVQQLDTLRTAKPQIFALDESAYNGVNYSIV